MIGPRAACTAWEPATSRSLTTVIRPRVNTRKMMTLSRSRHNHSDPEFEAMTDQQEDRDTIRFERIQGMFPVDAKIGRPERASQEYDRDSRIVGWEYPKITRYPNGSLKYQQRFPGLRE